MRVQPALIAVVAPLCTGCPQDPAETVILHLTGDTKTNELVLERIIPRLLDPGRTTTVSYQHAPDGSGTYATVSPVSNVELFASRCSFGNVVRREQRELWVSVDPDQTRATTAWYWIADRTVELVIWWDFVRSVARDTFATVASAVLHDHILSTGDNKAIDAEPPTA